MKLIFIFFVLINSLFIFSQSSSEPDSQILKSKSHDPLQGKNLDEADKVLSNLILNLSEGLKVHSKVLVTKIKILPRNTVLYKGKLEGENCKTHEKKGDKEELELVDQESPENNCIKLEVFDFVTGGLKRPAFGPKTKYMIIGFDDDPSKEKNPRLTSPRKVKFIRSSVLVDNLYAHDRKLLEVVDENPISGDPNENIYIATQVDYNPVDFKKENPSDIASGKHRLGQIENSKVNPVRTIFKRDSYVKHLQAYHELFSKIYEFNDKNNTAKMRENSNFIKDSFKY